VQKDALVASKRSFNRLLNLPNMVPRDPLILCNDIMNRAGEDNNAFSPRVAARTHRSLGRISLRIVKASDRGRTPERPHSIRFCNGLIGGVGGFATSVAGAVGGVVRDVDFGTYIRVAAQDRG
jgi:hypothetical protein